MPFRIVGFDCAEEEHSAVMLDEDGEIILKTKVVNRRDSVEDALSKLALSVPPGTGLIVSLESERSHGRLVTDVANALGIRVWKVKPVALNRFREVEGQPHKDDDWDAYLAARMVYLRTKGCREIVEHTDEERALSRLGRSHDRLSRDKTQHTLQLRAHLLELAPEILHREWTGPKVGSKAMEYLLERWPGFIGMEKAQLRSIEKILNRCRYGAEARRVAKLLRDMARRIDIAERERSVIALETGFLIRQIQFCKAGQAEVRAEISLRVRRHPIGKKLLEMPGIGEIVAGVLLSELWPVARTTTEAKSATFSGVTPLNRKTGKMPEHRRLARGVNKRILTALYRSSVVAIGCSAIDKAYYTKKIHDYNGHPKPHVAAFIALSRQRHKVIFKLLTTEARFDKEVLIGRHLERLEEERGAAA
jgi:transposase